MDFTFTSEQEMLRETARGLLAKECPTSLVRAVADDASAADPLWKHLREWTALAGDSFVDLCLFLEETGAVCAPGPFFATTALFAPLARHVDADLHARALAGEVTGTVAMAGAAGEWVPNDDPVKTFVLDAAQVEHVAIVQPGPQVLLVSSPNARATESIDGSRRFYEVDDVRGEATGIVGDALRDVVERATVALAAELLGTTRWLFDTTLAYAKMRHQFDRPIGSFQAIKHKLATMKIEWERAWSAVYYAAMTIDADDPDRHRAAHAAKIAAGDAARLNAKDALQIHGGIGYTWEHDLHLFLRRAYASEHLLGTTGYHTDRLATLIFDA